MVVLPTMYFRNRGSSAITSGSGYWIGCCPDQSRGVGTGDTGCCGAWAASGSAAIAAPRNDLRSKESFGGMHTKPSLSVPSQESAP